MIRTMTNNICRCGDQVDTPVSGLWEVVWRFAELCRELWRYKLRLLKMGLFIRLFGPEMK